MNARVLSRTLSACAVLALLVACGGGSDSAPAPVAVVPTAPDLGPARMAFASDYTKGLAALATFEGLNSAGFVELFDETFLDAGYTKAQLRSSLAQEAAAMATSADLSGFPLAAASNMTVGDCDAANVCAVTVTFSNTDADTTAVTLTMRAKLSDGKFRHYGDQKSS